MAVGDIASSARGSGARFNDGKAALELIPLHVLADAWWRDDFTADEKAAHAALVELAAWQATGAVGSLYAALRALGNPFHECAAVLDYGRRKYAAWNWAKGMPWSVCVGCAARHFEKILVDGEDLDPESGLTHRGHLACNLVFLIAYH